MPFSGPGVGEVSDRDDHGISAAGGAGCRILARRGGVSGLIALGFAVLVFLFSWVLYAPLLPFMPDSTLDPLRWILWSLFSDIAVVFMAAAAGASLDRWAAWVRGVFDNLLKRFG